MALRESLKHRTTPHQQAPPGTCVPSPRALRFQAAVKARFPSANQFSICACRKTRVPTAGGGFDYGNCWTTHAWGEAVDVFGPIDDIAAWTANLEVRIAYSIVESYKEGSHVHTQFIPSAVGCTSTPPCAGGPATNTDVGAAIVPCRHPNDPHGVITADVIAAVVLAAGFDPNTDVYLNRAAPTGPVSPRGGGLRGRVGSPAQIAVAIALAESGGHFCAENSIGARGLWQILRRAHPEVTDNCAFSPRCSAAATFRISKAGHDWSQWSTFGNDAFRSHLGEAQAAIDASHATGFESGADAALGGSGAPCNTWGFKVPLGPRICFDKPFAALGIAFAVAVGLFGIYLLVRSSSKTGTELRRLGGALAPLRSLVRPSRPSTSAGASSVLSGAQRSQQSALRRQATGQRFEREEASEQAASVRSERASERRDLSRARLRELKERRAS